MGRKSIFSQDNDYRRMLHSGEWQRLRALKLAQSPQCEICAANRRYRMATEVHHRAPVLSAPDAMSRHALFFDIGNLMSLCHECHVEIHRLAGKNTKGESQKRTGDRLAAFTERYGL